MRINRRRPALGAPARIQHADRADVYEMALAFGHHARQENHIEAQATKIIELRGAFEVVKTVVIGLHRAADGTARIVDQEVNASVIGNQHLQKEVEDGHVGNVGRVSHKVCTLWSWLFRILRQVCPGSGRK